MFFKFFKLSLILNIAHGFFYVTDLNDLKSETNSSLIKDFRIDLPEILGDAFPRSFSVEFTELEQNFSIEFEKYELKVDNQLVKNLDDIYIIDPTSKQPVKYSNSMPSENYGLYVQKYGDGFATLIQNRRDDKNRFRLFGTVYSNGTDLAFDIAPLVDKRFKRGVNYDSKRNYHKITRRSITEDPSEIELIHPEDDLKDYIVLPDTPINAKKNYKFMKKRALNGQPITLNVELLVVTDSTVFNTHQKFAGTSNTEIVFLHMRHYYAHLMHGVNQRYQNSLRNDPDLRINIVLTNFLFLTDPSEQLWLNPQFVGNAANPTFNGREVVITFRTLNAFADYMNKKVFPFSYDHAVALFNKDLWSSDQSASRSMTVGFASIGTICNSYKFSLCEDIGGFTNLLVIAHEIAHGLGAFHDGVIGSTDRCLISQKDIMSPSVGGGSSNKFSTCSISMFKSTLLNRNLDGVAPNAQCLLNVPQPAVEVSRVENSDPGDLYSLDDSCKMIYGPEASFCRNRADVLCQTLSCRPNSTSTSCLQSYGGSPDGTPCDTGKVCFQGVCTSSSKGKYDYCLFGDDVVTREVEIEIPLPSPQITCSQYFTLLQNYGRSIIDYCSRPNIKSVCCQSCKKYNLLTCKDSYLSCPSASACNSQVVFGNQVRFIYDLCQRTCQRCKPLTCSEAPTICENGGTCFTVSNTATNSLFAFRCVCPQGYTGEYCEKSLTTNPCTSNPCKNGGTCYSFTSTMYICVCPSSCNDLNCNNCGSQALPVPIVQVQADSYCADERQFCKLFIEYCNDDAFFEQKTIRQVCARTCNACPKQIDSNCQDQDPRCPDFKQSCFIFDIKYFNGEWLKHPCLKTCGYC
ncbi:unnamed protein product [Brachionus calyciflorus]|uniref:Uncharacterized protein n=1 Tax=Brachionus calyciflorus TaxID=104777 RepID=A0A813N3K9_9BILA|nr:unnamed protein product [Brachionus calyciflorus]